MAGDEVRQVQERLDRARVLRRPDRRPVRSAHRAAVWAYEKLVMHVPRDEATGIVTDEMWQDMQRPDPHRAEPLAPKGQATREPHRDLPARAGGRVLRRRRRAMIVHISSGDGQEWKEASRSAPASSATRTAPSRSCAARAASRSRPAACTSIERMVDGLRKSALGGMLNPVYFNYGIAMHGAINVPLQPASHGCIRIPRPSARRSTSRRDRRPGLRVGRRQGARGLLAEPQAAYPRGPCRSSTASTRPTRRRRPRPRRPRPSHRTTAAADADADGARHRRRPGRHRRATTPPPSRRRPRRRRPSTAAAADDDLRPFSTDATSATADRRFGGQRRQAGDQLDAAVEHLLEQALALVGGVQLEADVGAVGGDGRDDERPASSISARTPPTRPSWQRSRPIATRRMPASAARGAGRRGDRAANSGGTASARSCGGSGRSGR